MVVQGNTVFHSFIIIIIILVPPSLVPRPFSYAHAREGKEGSGK